MYIILQDSISRIRFTGKLKQNHGAEKNSIFSNKRYRLLCDKLAIASLGQVLSAKQNLTASKFCTNYEQIIFQDFTVDQITYNLYINVCPFLHKIKICCFLLITPNNYNTDPWKKFVTIIKTKFIALEN